MVKSGYWLTFTTTMVPYLNSGRINNMYFGFITFIKSRYISKELTFVQFMRKYLPKLQSVYFCSIRISV